MSPATHGAVTEAILAHLERAHREAPLAPGEDLAVVRSVAAAAARAAGAPADPELIDALLDDLVTRDRIAREGATVRLASHRVSLAGREPEVEGLVAAVGEGEPTPPSVAELVARGYAADVIDAATRAGHLVRLNRELVATPGFVQRALELVRSAGEAGITVSALRQGLGTSRKYAVPLLEHLDERGLTRRVGDVRVLREPG